MQGLWLSRYIATLGITSAMLSGCGGSQPPIGAPGMMPQGNTIAQHAAPVESWMLPEASSEDLIYAACNCDGVFVLSYPDGKIVGNLILKEAIWNLCVDAAQNVYFVLGNGFNQSEIDEYPHGGTTPIRTFADIGGLPSSCSVDETTGKLAVTHIHDAKEGPGNVTVFLNPSLQPQIYSDPDLQDILSSSYDASGNLLIGGCCRYAVLLKNSATFSDVSITDGPSYRGTIVWDGQYFALGNHLVWHSRHRTIYRVQLVGSKGTVVGKTKLAGQDVSFDYIAGGTAIAAYGGKQRGIGLWRYPSGGNPYESISGFLKESSIVGIALSLGSKPLLAYSGRGESAASPRH